MLMDGVGKGGKRGGGLFRVFIISENNIWGFGLDVYLWETKRMTMRGGWGAARAEREGVRDLGGM